MPGCPHFEVELTRKGSTTTTSLFNFHKINIQRSMESKTNKIEITFPNHFGRYSGEQDSDLDFREDDVLDIYASEDVINKTNHLLVSAIVRDYTPRLDTSGKRTVLINGTDRTYDLLSTIYAPGKFDFGDGKTASSAIIDIVTWVTAQNSDSGTGAITTTNVATTPTTKSSDPAGTATFVTIQLAYPNKTAYEWISDLSIEPHTNYTIGGTEYKSGRSYKFFIDKDSDLHWEYPDDTQDGTIDIGKASDQVISVNIKKSVFDVINLVYFDCGNDNNGDAIKWYVYDTESEVPELKSKFLSFTDIATTLKDRERRVMDDKLAGAYDTNGFPDNYTNYNNEATLPVWDTTQAPTSDSEYTGSINGNTGFRWACVEIGIGRALERIRLSAGLRWKGTIELKGTTSYTIGDLLSVTYKDYNMVNVLMRLISITDTFDKGGWFTTLELKQDENEILET